MEGVKLKFYDRNTIFKETIGFLKKVYDSSRQSFFISILLIVFLVLIDFLARETVKLLFLSDYNFLREFANFISKCNSLFGVKFLDYFKDVIVIVAGILGVILGLFFTTFLNIITSKYSNINSAIINQLLEQKIINRYFKFLAILVSSSIIFQFLLVVGYKPTFLSAFIFTFVVLIALLAFLAFGRYSLIYFNAGNLVFDLIHSSNKSLNRFYKNKNYFYLKDNGRGIIASIIRNINKIGLIVEESLNPQLRNTSLDSISETLLDFSKRYNSFKHTFPSHKSWHPIIQKYKRWDEVTSVEHDMFAMTGSPLYPETVDDYLYVEKLIINTQFSIFESLSVDERIEVIYNQYSYLQIISTQCETELFKLFFDNLEGFVKKNLKPEKEDKLVRDNFQLISLYGNLMIQYLVGFNHNLDNIFGEEKIKNLAKSIHFKRDTDKISFPYQIRIWLDNYKKKLETEKLYEKKALTPLFYTEYELSHQYYVLLKKYFEEISLDINNRVLSFSNFLSKNEYEFEAVGYMIECLDSFRKIEYFSGILKNKIETQVNSFNLKKELDYKFSEREDILKKNSDTKTKVIDQIWEVGYTSLSYSVDGNDFPDLFGNCYLIICQDILERAFKIEGNQLEEYLHWFYVYNKLYYHSLMIKVEHERIEYTSSKLYPLVMDLFEVSSIAIILFKLFKSKSLEKKFFDYWDNEFENDEEELSFWKKVYTIFNYFQHSSFAFSQSNIRENDRKEGLVEFLKTSEFIKKGKRELSRRMPIEEVYFETDSEDPFIREIVKNLQDGNSFFSLFKLSDVFIEYFLRTRIALKDLDIKETHYGSYLSGHLG